MIGFRQVAGFQKLYILFYQHYLVLAIGIVDLHKFEVRSFINPEWLVEVEADCVIEDES